MTAQLNHQQIAAHLNTAGHPVSQDDVIPTTSETPIKRTPELDQVEADITGEDLSYIAKGTLGPLTGNAPTSRVTRSIKFFNLLKERVLRKKKADEEIIIK